METGRPARSTQADFGPRIRSLREAAGLTQQQVAEYLGISQPSYARWELRNVALHSHQLVKLTEVLNVTADELLGIRRPRKGGPTGKGRQLFENVSKLPRSRQQRILGVVEDMLSASKG